MFYFCACILLCGFAYIVFDDNGHSLERAIDFIVWPIWGMLFFGSGVIVILDFVKGKKGDGNGVRIKYLIWKNRANS